MIVLPATTRTFLFTDIEGSTRRWEHQRAAMGAALVRHDALLRSAIEGHGGTVFKTADPADALVAAVAAQRGLLAEDWSWTSPPSASAPAFTPAARTSAVATTSGRRSTASPA